jgi:DNA-binding NtrC family response regulator/tetratricopeptide (TPR) repeat protein
MRSDKNPLHNELLLALGLMRHGRFTEAVKTLQRPGLQNDNLQHQALLADVLQRTGRNEQAEAIAARCIRGTKAPSDVTARCHFVLANVLRERGDMRKSIDQYLAAEKSGGSDIELLCWVQLRLLAAISEVNGGEAAMSRVSGLKLSLARCGEARPFAAFHLWIAETESTRGNLTAARRHLRIAESLLKQVDDAWLQGYLAINSFGVSYHCADILEARKWAQIAVEQSRLSGHNGARRAAQANLGHIQLSLGRLSDAHKCFQIALEYCEEGSATYIALLDSLAQTKLHGGDLLGCQEIIDQIDKLSVRSDPSKPGNYRAWALQTKIQLLLKQGHVAEAMATCNSVRTVLRSDFHPRVTTVLRLLSIETHLAAGELLEAARQLQSLFLSAIELPPDLFAETERVVGKVLLACGVNEAAKIYFDRAIRTFDVLGHVIGKNNVALDSGSSPAPVSQRNAPSSIMCSLDRVRALLETRKRPELFGEEALHLLRDLECTDSLSLTAGQVHHTHQTAAAESESAALQFRLPIESRDGLHLEFVSKNEPSAIVRSLIFQVVVRQILAIRDVQSEFEGCDMLWSETNGTSPHESIFASEGMLQILKTIKKIASTNLSVLITGETGAGKEIIARAVHKNSNRALEPFIAFNCAAVPKDLLESQLFGYKRGAFSGAIEPFQGVVRAACGGTLFLDEIGDIPLDMQPKLLRFLESFEIHPLGESRPSKVNVRLLFATNTNLEDAVRQKRFREDLFFRMNVISIRVPPLRERREEIPLLANLFAHQFCNEVLREVPQFSTEAMESLILYSWPGNVRQLGNEIRRLIATAETGTVITSDLLSPEILTSNSDAPRRSTQSAQITVQLDQSMPAAIAQLEGLMVRHALNQANGQATKAARLLGLSRKGLYLKRQRLGVVEPIDDTMMPVSPSQVSAGS